MKIITIQPEAFVDNVWGIPGRDGREGTILEGRKTPYPYHVDETGEVRDQDFWRGDPFRVLGFQNDADVQRVDLWWEDAAADPDAIVGKFPVMVEKQHNGDTRIYTYTLAIESVKVREVAA